MEKELFLEEFDGVRSIIVGDDCEAERHWWIIPQNAGDSVCDVEDVYSGTLEDIAERIKASIPDVGAFMDGVMAQDEWFNPAWDRFETLDRAEEHEAATVDEPVEYRYIKLA